MAGTKTALFSRKTPGGVFNVEDQSMTTGDRWFVHSGTGTDGAGYGQHPDSPCATIDYAIGLATASQGDIVFVMPGHAETIAAAGIIVDKIGLSIIGLGHDRNRPTITFNATTSDIDVTATDVLIKNLRCLSTVDNLAKFVDAQVGRMTIEDCEFITTSTCEAYCFILLTTTKDDWVIRGCRFIQPTDPEGTDGNASQGCIYFEDCLNILIEDCVFIGEFETSIIHNKTTKTGNLWIKNCYGEQALAGADVMTLVAASTGGMVRCSWNVPDAADATESNFVTLAADTPFGFHDTTFMLDNNAGGNLAIAVTAAAS